MGIPRSFEELAAKAAENANSAEPTLEISPAESLIIFAKMGQASEVAGGRIPTESDYIGWQLQCRNGQAAWGGCKLIIKP
jgi:hypothetical protein